MELKEAIKKVRAGTRAKGSYLVVHMSYDKKVVLPYKDGMAFMAALDSMELLDEEYSTYGKHRIVPVDRGVINATPMSGDEYEYYKIAALLDMTFEDVKKMMKSPEAIAT